MWRASSETRAHFAIEADGSFLLDILMIETEATYVTDHLGGNQMRVMRFELTSDLGETCAKLTNS